jgi:hypothetical protein
MSASSAAGPPAPSETRRVIAAYPSYVDAERAVDWLSDQGFAVERVSIVGRGLRSVEQVSGRMTTARAALTGAGQGAVIGLIFALFFGIFFAGPAFLGLLLYAVAAGALFGAALGAIAHGAQGGGRDFTSVSGIQADHYEVQVDEAAADEAKRLLDAMPAGR